MLVSPRSSFCCPATKHCRSVALLHSSHCIRRSAPLLKQIVALLYSSLCSTRRFVALLHSSLCSIRRTAPFVAPPCSRPCSRHCNVALFHSSLCSFRRAAPFVALLHSSLHSYLHSSLTKKKLPGISCTRKKSNFPTHGNRFSVFFPAGNHLPRGKINFFFSHGTVPWVP